MTAKSAAGRRTDYGSEADLRIRILDAAFAAFMEHGYAATSTLEIATRARASKRELYALFGSKEQMLAACITDRAGRFQPPADLPPPRDRDMLAQRLTSFGAQLLREVTDPAVLAVFRLAIAEAINAPEVARALDGIGREATRAALRRIMCQAAESGLLRGHPAELAEQFSGLLWGNLLVSSLLGVAGRPGVRETATRARHAADAFLRLNPAKPNR